jgi:hypothetical protein
VVIDSRSYPFFPFLSIGLVLLASRGGLGGAVVASAEPWWRLPYLALNGTMVQIFVHSSHFLIRRQRSASSPVMMV